MQRIIFQTHSRPIVAWRKKPICLIFAFLNANAGFTCEMNYLECLVNMEVVQHSLDIEVIENHTNCGTMSMKDRNI